MTKISTLHDQWLKTPGYQDAYEESHAEFELARQLIEARTKSGFSQEEIATRMGTSQSAVARLESGSTLPSMRTLSAIREGYELRGIHSAETYEKKLQRGFQKLVTIRF